MPNWCYNKIEISGETETIKSLWEKAKEGGLLSAMIPQPEDIIAEDIIEWRIDNWGTKWDVDRHGLEFIDHGDDTASISGWFDSAWSPPINAYSNYCADKIDDVYIEAWYYEDDDDFAGHYTSDGIDDVIEDLSPYARCVIKNKESGCHLYDELDKLFDITEFKRALFEVEDEAEEEDESEEEDNIAEAATVEVAAPKADVEVAVVKDSFTKFNDEKLELYRSVIQEFHRRMIDALPKEFHNAIDDLKRQNLQILKK